MGPGPGWTLQALWQTSNGTAGCCQLAEVECEVRGLDVRSSSKERPRGARTAERRSCGSSGSEPMPVSGLAGAGGDSVSPLSGIVAVSILIVCFRRAEALCGANVLHEQATAPVSQTGDGVFIHPPRLRAPPSPRPSHWRRRWPWPGSVPCVGPRTGRPPPPPGGRRCRAAGLVPEGGHGGGLGRLGAYIRF